MTTTPEGFITRLNRLKSDLTEQGRRVQALLEAAFNAAFDRDRDMAGRVVELDKVIDRVDIEIERAAVVLLTDVAESACQLDPKHLRMVLTIVKVNNELERVADRGVSIAELVQQLTALEAPLPPTFRVLANSVIGILRDANESLDRLEANLAGMVLSSEDTVEEFKRQLLRDIQAQVASGQISVDAAFQMYELATFCEIVEDHCTNIAEQVLYVVTGQIYRHTEGHWEQIQLSN